jgi:hypothetical protein
VNGSEKLARAFSRRFLDLLGGFLEVEPLGRYRGRDPDLRQTTIELGAGK